MAVTHTKTDNIPNWTQTDLNTQIAAGNFPVGTTLNDIVLPTDWNAQHVVSILDADVASGAAIDASKIANGSVSNTEFQFLDGTTSNIQTQINGKGSGTVNAVSIATANGFSGSSSGGTTPALAIAAGNITPNSVIVPAATAALPSISLPTTGIYEADTNVMGFSAAGSEIGRLSASGISIGTGADPVSGMPFQANSTGVNCQGQLNGTQATGWLAFTYNSSASQSPSNTFGHSRGSIATPTTTVNGDTLGSLRFQGYGATGFKNSGIMQVLCIEPTPSDTKMGGSIRFNVAALGGVAAFTAATEVMRLETATGLTVTGPASASSTIGTTQAIGNTSTDGLISANTTPATVGAQKWSPRVRLTGQGWKTASTAGSQTVDWIIENQPVQGSANPSTNLVISNQINASGYNPSLTLPATGGLNLAAGTYQIGGTQIAASNLSNGTTGTGVVVLENAPTLDQPNIVGVTTNSNAATGSVGEYVVANVAVASAVSLTTDMAANVTSISLTAGDWDVRGQIGFTPAATTTTTQFIAALSRTTAALPADASDDTQSETISNEPSTANQSNVLPLATARMSLSGTTIVYLVARSTFGISTNKAYGWISARRIQ